MKFYYSSESAPLKFHKAFYKVISPILIVCHTILLLATIGHIINDDGHYDLILLILDLVICSISIVLLGYITYGFTNKKEYAWHLVYAYLVTTVLTRIIAAAMAENAAVAIGQIIGSFIIPILVGVYYYKRKPLFVASEVEYQNGTTNYAVQSQVCGSVQDLNNKVEINYCSACGSKLVKDSAFCHKCGYKIKGGYTTEKCDGCEKNTPDPSSYDSICDRQTEEYNNEINKMKRMRFIIFCIVIAVVEILILLPLLSNLFHLS